MKTIVHIINLLLGLEALATTLSHPQKLGCYETKGEGLKKGIKHFDATVVHVLSFVGKPILCKEIDFHPTLGSLRSIQMT